MSVTIANAVNAYKQALAKLDKAGLEPRDPADNSDFATLMSDAVKSAGEAVASGEKASVNALTGGGAELTDVITAVSNAELTLQTVVTVRDRVIQAYQEIIRMPI